MAESHQNLFWAKTSRTDEKRWHSLVCHMLDSGMVARALWEHSLSGSFKRDISQALSLDMSQARDLLAFWVSLHDIGKAGPEFQRKWDTGMQRVRQAGFDFPPCAGKITGFHGLATTWILRDYWQEVRYTQRQFCIALAITLGGHHGEFPSNQDIMDRKYQECHLGNDVWKNARRSLIHEMEKHFSPPAEFSIPAEMQQMNSFLFLAAGMTTVADWIASDDALFPYDNGLSALDTYIKRAELQAREALEKLGWCGWQATGEPLSFEELFPQYVPSVLQKAFIRETGELSSPFLVILEAPTGSGKTEMAFHLGDGILQKEFKSGIYIAMPTMATSNQMFERTVKFLSKRYPAENLEIQLVHGASIIDERFKEIRMKGIAQDHQGHFGNVTASEWFLPHKKSLLAPFGIGTVDQAFLSVMRSKHFFLRLFGLAQKVLIFDEVHAYDVYMMQIFKRLLTWLRAVNTSVIILSATLPAVTRRDLLQTYHATETSDEGSYVEFPRISFSSAQGTGSISLGKVPSRSVTLQWIEADELVSIFRQKLASGGNAALICNRVDAAIEFYEQFLEYFSREELVVFHSRFPFCRREQIESEIKLRYGKDCAKRPRRSIVIATQVIEQSLDLDFDVMASALAPVDLLIQRVGRLQRHQHIEHPPLRPDAVHQPSLLLLKPQLEKTLPDFGKDVYIYEPYLLQRTWFALQQRSELVLPEQTDELIERVYDDRPMPGVSQDVWQEMQEYLQKMKRCDEGDGLKAANQLLPSAEKRILGNLQASFDDEHDAGSLSVMHTLTRNALPSVQLVCLIKKPQGLFTLDGNRPIDLERELDFGQVTACLRSSVSMSNRVLVDYFLSCEVPACWKKSAALRTRIPVEFENAKYQGKGFTLVLDDEKGLYILK